jgi:membrane protein required for beta-lactamase induction
MALEHGQGLRKELEEDLAEARRGVSAQEHVEFAVGLGFLDELVFGVLLLLRLVFVLLWGWVLLLLWLVIARLAPGEARLVGCAHVLGETLQDLFEFLDFDQTRGGGGLYRRRRYRRCSRS